MDSLRKFAFVKTRVRPWDFSRVILRVLLAGVFLCIIPAQSFGAAKEAAALSSARIGVGRGIPYGGKGTNLEFVWGDKFALTVGAGTSRPEGRHWVYGGRIYSEKKKTGLNPRFTVFYGALGRVKSAGGVPVEVLKGTVLGGGFDWLVTTRLSFDFDWFYYRRIEKPDPGFSEDKGRMMSFGLGIKF